MLMLAGTLPACSDAGGNEPVERSSSLECDDAAFAPCGGDVKGAWQLEEGCFRGTNVTLSESSDDSCAIRSITMNPEVDGNIEFGDRSFSHSLFLHGTLVLHMAPTCLPATGSCSALESVFPVTGLTCTGVATLGCDCAVEMVEDGETEQGRYETSGNALILYYEDELEPDTVKYCRRGNELLATIPLSELFPNAALTVLFRKH